MRNPVFVRRGKGEVLKAETCGGRGVRPLGKTYDIRNNPRRPAGDCALLNNHRSTLGVLRDRPRRRLEGAQVRAGAGPDAVRLGGRVDADEDDVCLGDARGDVGREEEVGLARRQAEARRLRHAWEPRDRGLVGAVAGDPHDLGEACLMDGQVIRVPCCDALGVEVHDVDDDRRVMVGNEGCRWATWRTVSRGWTDTG